MKAQALTLSQHLLQEAERFMGYPGRVGRGRVGKAAAAIWNSRLLPTSTRSLTWIVPRGKGFRPTSALLDEFYSKQLLAEVPRIVERAMALEPLESSASVPRPVNLYLEQATRAFVAGLWDGAVALSRACLEATLEDRLGRLLGGQTRDLGVWLNEGERLRLLTRTQLTRARKIQRLGNEILHERNATEDDANEALDELRKLLAEQYR